MTTGINAFDRVVINPRERPLSSDINMAQARAEQSLKSFIRSLALKHASGAGIAGASAFTPPAMGFIGDALFPTAPGTNRTVTLTPGLGMVLGSSPVSNFGGVSGVDDLDAYFPVVMPAAVTVAVDAAPTSGQERFDIIEVKQDRRLENPLSRDVLNTSTGLFEAGSVSKTFAYALDQTRQGRVVSPSDSATGVGYKVGVAAATGSATIPATSVGYTRIAVVHSAGGSTNVAQSDLRDDRALLFPNGNSSFGLIITQVDGTPDVIAVQANPCANAGLRFAARALSGTPQSDIRVYVFGGAGVNVVPIVQIACNTSIPGFPNARFSAAQVSVVQQGFLTATEAALIAACPAYGDNSPTYPSQVVGQPYTFFDVTWFTYDGSEGTGRNYYVTGAVSNL